MKKIITLAAAVSLVGLGVARADEPATEKKMETTTTVTAPEQTAPVAEKAAPTKAAKKTGKHMKKHAKAAEKAMEKAPETAPPAPPAPPAQ